MAWNKGVHPIDTHVGRQLCVQRLSVSLSREQLAAKVNLTPSIIQRYENGVERISAATLYLLSRALNVPVSYFFDGFVHP